MKYNYKLISIIIICLLSIIYWNKEGFQDWRGIEHEEEHTNEKQFKKYKISDKRFWTRFIDYVITGETRDEAKITKFKDCTDFKKAYNITNEDVFNEQKQIQSMQDIFTTDNLSGDALNIKKYKNYAKQFYCAYDYAKEKYDKIFAEDKPFSANSTAAITGCDYQGYKENLFAMYDKPGFYPAGVQLKNGTFKCNISQGFDFKENSIDAKYFCNGKSGYYDPSLEKAICNGSSTNKFKTCRKHKDCAGYKSDGSGIACLTTDESLPYSGRCMTISECKTISRNENTKPKNNCKLFYEEY